MSNPFCGEVLAERYRVDDLLETRGMNDLYRGTDLTSGAVVAVRVLSTRWARHAPSIARSIEETLQAAALGHPSLVPVLHAGPTTEGGCATVVPWLEGGDLGRLLVAGRALPAADVAALLTPIASALDALHRSALVHRTLTPSRILTTNEPPYMLLGGVGYSPLVAPTGDDHDRPTGTIAGPAVLDYLAPETDRGANAGHRVDVYALAAIAFRAIAGVPAFEPESSLVRALVARQDAPPPSLSARARSPVPAELEAVMRKGLAVDPADRFPLASAFVRELARVTMGIDSESAVDAALVRAALERARRNGEEPTSAPMSSPEARPTIPLETAAASSELARAILEREPSIEIVLGPPAPPDEPSLDADAPRAPAQERASRRESVPPAPAADPTSAARARDEPPRDELRAVLGRDRERFSSRPPDPPIVSRPSSGSLASASMAPASSRWSVVLLMVLAVVAISMWIVRVVP